MKYHEDQKNKNEVCLSEIKDIIKEIDFLKYLWKVDCN